MAQFRSSLTRYLAIGSVVLGLGLVGSSQLRMQQLVGRLDQEAAARVATQCVASWERISQIRDADEASYRRNAKTLLSFADPHSEKAELYRAQVERDIVEIRATIHNPDCDLKAAKSLLSGT